MRSPMFTISFNPLFGLLALALGSPLVPAAVQTAPKL